MGKLMMTVALSVGVSSGAMATAGSEGASFDWDAWADEHFVEADQCRPSAYAQALKLVREAEDRFNAGEVSFDELLCSAELEEAVRYIEDHCGGDKDSFSSQLFNGFQGTRDPAACQAVVRNATIDGCALGAGWGAAPFIGAKVFVPQVQLSGAVVGGTVGCVVKGYNNGAAAWGDRRGPGQACEPK